MLRLKGTTFFFFSPPADGIDLELYHFLCYKGLVLCSMCSDLCQHFLFYDSVKKGCALGPFEFGYLQKFGLFFLGPCRVHAIMCMSGKLSAGIPQIFILKVQALFILDIGMCAVQGGLSCFALCAASSKCAYVYD